MDVRNWAWMTKMCNSIHNASCLCHTSSSILAEEAWLASLSAIQDQMFPIGVKPEDCADQGTTSQFVCSLRRQLWNRVRPSSSMILSNPLIPYLYDSGLISTSETDDIKEF
ncbi:hypothetical protein TNCV_2467731 [Trichonephila clavipes]|nr:hypothetical protein TNCV_2467731 [Trichonephila clavipes]